MAFTSKALFQGTMLTTSAVTQYTCPASQRTTVTKYTVTNVTAASAKATLYIIASGGSAADRYKIYHEVTLAANESKDVVQMRHTLEPGDFIQALSDTASALNNRASGLLVSI